MSLPARFGFKSVSRFLGTIDTLHASWPNPILVDPAPLASETYRSRFRDALSAILIHNQFPEYKVKVLKIASVRVEEKGTQLLMGPEDELKKMKQTSAPVGTVIDASATIDSSADALQSPSSEVLNALFVLLTRGVIHAFTVSRTTEDFIRQHMAEDAPFEVMDKGDHFLIF